MSASIRARGTSPVFSVSAEPIRESKKHKTSRPPVGGWPNPPSMAPGNNYSELMSLKHKWPHWMGSICPPVFDGFSQYSGEPSNSPDFIREDHFICIMRCVDEIVKPMFTAKVKAQASMPQPKPMPRE